MNARNRFALLCLAALAMTLALTACGSGGDTTQSETGSAATGASTESEPGAEAPGEGVPGEEGASKVPTIVVENGEPLGGVARLEFNAGEQVRFKVKGDEAEEVHLHGYDLMEDIPQGGGTVEFSFPAEIEGIFEGELEGQGVQILELRVNP